MFLRLLIAAIVQSIVQGIIFFNASFFFFLKLYSHTAHTGDKGVRGWGWGSFNWVTALLHLIAQSAINTPFTAKENVKLVTDFIDFK